MMKQILPNLFLYEDTCHVYVIKNNDTAVLIDFGEGLVLEHLDEIGVKEVTDILMTHHHRDQAQGLNRAVEKGIRIRVPHIEQELFQEADAHWQARQVDNDYNMRQDRFSILNSVPVDETLKDYAKFSIRGLDFEILPSPGHTVGSISVLAEIDNKRVAFTGDLICAPGKVWSLSSSQWTYNGAEGIPYSVLSLLSLQDKKPDLLLPSHGEVMEDPGQAIQLLVERLRELMSYRKQNPRLFRFRDHPYEPITPHLLKNQTSFANSYVLISESKKALIIDFGYDFIGGLAMVNDRSGRRPWLYTIPKLKEQYGIEKIDVVLPTHFHDDHIAGFNLLKDIEGTEVWCPENFADILEQPKAYNLPCLWFDPIAVDRRLPLEKNFKWEEYEFTLHEQGGHTLYAVAIEFEADGKKILAIGDQYQGEDYNYVYHNGFRIEDYRLSAELYARLQPDLLIAGHNDPIEITAEFLQSITEKGIVLEKLHKELLPLDEIDFGAEGFGASITPYQKIVQAGDSFDIDIKVKNPFSEPHTAAIKVVIPDGWKQDQKEWLFDLGAHESQTINVTLTSPQQERRRDRVAVDLTVGTTHFGEQAEALYTVKKE